MPRSLLIFKHQHIAAIPAPTDFSVTAKDLEEQQNTPQAILLNLIPDADRLQLSSRFKGVCWPLYLSFTRLAVS
jgi:uncharacterized SAM-binding protein YcdF (DUF218 family)